MLNLDDLKNKILNDDCIEIMQSISDQSIDMVLCDLPYAITQNRWDILVPMQPLWEAYSRILKPNGCVVLTSYGKFTAQLILASTIKYQYSMVWCKPNHTNQLNAKIQPLRKRQLPNAKAVRLVWSPDQTIG